jgi:hypothetical protein
VRSLAAKGLQIVGAQASGSSYSANSSSSSSSSSSSRGTGGQHRPLAGTPQEPYANPRHPNAQPDSSSNILAGNPLEEYANPSPQWQQAAGAAAAALEEAERQLPASTPATSSASRSSIHGQPTAARDSSSTAAAAAAAAASGGGGGAVTTGLGPSPRVQPLLHKLQAFMRDHVYPAGKHCAICQLMGVSIFAACSVRKWPNFLPPASCCAVTLPTSLRITLACLPAEATLNAHAISDARWSIHPVQEQLKEEAKRQGLWNLWLPAGA